MSWISIKVVVTGLKHLLEQNIIVCNIHLILFGERGNDGSIVGKDRVDT